MASSGLGWVRPILCEALASSKAGPRAISHAFLTTSSTVRAETPSSASSPVARRTSPNASSSSSNNIANAMSRLPGSNPIDTPRGSRAFLPRTEPFNLHIQSTRNNTILTLTTPQGAPVKRVTSGMCGFKKSSRSGYEAGHQSAIRMFDIINENRTSWRLAQLNLVFKGFGLGRDAVHRALLTDAGTQIRNLVVRVGDATRIRVGGCRPKKRRSEYNTNMPPGNITLLNLFFFSFLFFTPVL